MRNYEADRIVKQRKCHRSIAGRKLVLGVDDIEELMAHRGVTVTSETIRAWCCKLGLDYAKRVRASGGQLGDTWHLDEVYLKIGGCLQYLWRAVDQDGNVLDMPVQPHPDKKPAARFFKKLLRGSRYSPREVVTDWLRQLQRAVR